MNSMQTPSEPGNVIDLHALSTVPLTGAHQSMLNFARSACGGSGPWQQRKISDVRDLLALAQVSRRFSVLWIDLLADIHLLIDMAAAVPCLPDVSGPLRMACGARLGIRYPQEALFESQPGAAFVQVLDPCFVWHPNVRYATSINQPVPLCLAPQFVAGTLLTEVVILSYLALTMQAGLSDPSDPAGVLNFEAARYYQKANIPIPLSREPFVKPASMK